MDISGNLSEHNNNKDKEEIINNHFFLLDPLSVIIKLAILGNKPVGTKILIQRNVIYLQEPGIFQPIARMFYKTTKEDLQYLRQALDLKTLANFDILHLLSYLESVPESSQNFLDLL